MKTLFLYFLLLFVSFGASASVIEDASFDLSAEDGFEVVRIASSTGAVENLTNTSSETDLGDVDDNEEEEDSSDDSNQVTGSFSVFHQPKIDRLSGRYIETFSHQKTPLYILFEVFRI